jgi:hypothetical protein
MTTPFEIESVKHSVSDQFGEADLIVVYKQLIKGECKRIAILIEDKIRACFQPDQSTRYNKRGDAGKTMHWDDCWTCLVAAATYIKPGHGFDTTVTLEQIKECFAVGEPKRSEFKARVIQKAIDKALSGPGPQRVDPEVTAFRERYYAAFVEFFAKQEKNVYMTPPRPAWSGETWFRILSGSVLPKGAYVHHKSAEGCVDLTFPNTDAKRLRDGIVEPCLEAGMEIEQTHKSATIRLRSSRIRQFKDFDQERAHVEEALSNASRLLHFYARECARLAPALKSASTAPI